MHLLLLKYGSIREKIPKIKMACNKKLLHVFCVRVLVSNIALQFFLSHRTMHPQNIVSLYSYHTSLTSLHEQLEHLFFIFLIVKTKTKIPHVFMIFLHPTFRSSQIYHELPSSLSHLQEVTSAVLDQDWVLFRKYLLIQFPKYNKDNMEQYLGYIVHKMCI